MPPISCSPRRRRKSRRSTECNTRPLLDEGKHYFLSRPRRFGKRLFLDTLKMTHYRELRRLLRERVLLVIRALGYEITVEESTVEESSSHGRLDMAVRVGGQVYLFEFKVVELAPPGSALAQLRERDYAAKYRGGDEPIHLIGVEFSRDTRNVTAFAVAAG